MARGNMRPEPWLKHLEEYNSFAGGTNIMVEKEQMKDNEAQRIINMDLTPRGGLKRRSGIKIHKRRLIWGDIKGTTWGGLNNG